MWNLWDIKMLHSLAHHMTWHLSQWPWLSHGGTIGGMIGLQSHLKWLVYHPMNLHPGSWRDGEPFLIHPRKIVYGMDMVAKFAIVKHAKIVHNHVLLQKKFPHLKFSLFWNTKNYYTNEKEKKHKKVWMEKNLWKKIQNFFFNKRTFLKT